MYEEIIEFLEKNKVPKFRQKQLEQAIFKNFVSDFEDITNFSKDLREKLKDNFSFSSLILVDTQKSKDSVKFVLKTRDGNYIESVLMLHNDGRRTVCVSSQVFCALGCKFCATGANKFRRNLDVEEIVEQVLFVSRYLKQKEERVTNVVFMGMGEPFLNFESVIESIEILNDENKFNIGGRHITISTSGIVPKIKEFADLQLQVRLAISLHAANDELRTNLMPINDKYNLKELFEVLDYYVQKTNKRVTYEYVLIKGINDNTKQAQQLVELLRNRLGFVNLLVYNEHEFVDFKKPDVGSVSNFKNYLQENGVEVAVRKSLGDDISGACGQLAGKK